MNMKRIFSIILVSVCAIVMPIQAVTRYSCDFENEAARARWVLNPTTTTSIYNQLVNKWYLGAPGNNDRMGSYGLYISDDGGQTAHYTNKSCWVFAYDTISLDHISGDYTLMFDYCSMANVASEFDGLYLFWIPMTEENVITHLMDSIPVKSNLNAVIPGMYMNYIVQLQPGARIDYLSANSTWHQCAAKISGNRCDGTPHYLAFVWTNGSNLAQQPGAMVDNISIRDTPPCPAPSNLAVSPNGTTINLSWTGTATNYEVYAYSYENGSWSGPKNVTGNQTSFTGLAVGQTDFVVRAICDDDDYSLKTIESKLVYYPDQMCVDYLNLDNAVCYVNNSSPDRSDNFNDFRVERVDHGPEKMSSRHTIHFDRTETEPRTGGLAKTIPDGELASIRLGNWDSDDQAERIEFSFNVDTIKYPVLLLKYMPLLEAPGHEDYENPRFLLDMLINGQSIGRCGMADFNANDVMNGNTLKKDAIAQGWHITKSEVAQTSDDVVWKEWTTVGVNLRKKEYQGKRLTVRLTTHDCTFSVHSGYAYFTLGCSDGKLKGMKCGEINPDFIAPDGFEYRWAYASSEQYRLPDRSLPEQYVLGRGQQYHAGMQDDNLYVVDCMFVQDTTCFFSLYASTLATNPISVIDHKIIRNCREDIYKVQFDGSKSWVQEIDHVLEDTLVSQNYHIETYEWNVEGIPYGWSDEVSPTFDFPMEGGDYDVTLRTTCGTCDSVLHYHLHLFPLGATRETQTYTLCDADRKGEGFHWKERSDTTYATYGIVDSVFLFSETTSCDSIIYLELVEPNRVFEDTLLLPEYLPFTYHDKVYPVGTTSLVDTVPDKNDCSKTWVLNLEIYESLLVEPAKAYTLCEGADTLLFVYDITRGRSQSFVSVWNGEKPDTLVNIEQKTGHYEIPLALDPTLEPGLYKGTLLFEDLKHEFSDTVPFELSLRYSPEIITQRWNDVLAIRNDSTIKANLGDHGYNYDFIGVQWYVSGQPIEGATEFNYYTGVGNELLFGKDYTALLTRKDGTQIFTCAFVPVSVPEAAMPYPQLTSTVVSPSAPIRLSGKGTAYWYDVLGRSRTSETYDNSDIAAPAAVGFYLLVLQPDDSSESANLTTHRVLVR